MSADSIEAPVVDSVADSTRAGLLPESKGATNDTEKGEIELITLD